MTSSKAPLWAPVIQAASAIRHRFWWTRAKTLGVRVVALDGGRVVLVRHSYVAGWFLPGGAIDAGEAPETAALRELREEAGVVATTRPVLHGFYRNRSHSVRDYVACYVLRDFDVVVRPPDWEIAEIGFFPICDLPEGTSPATRSRLAEVLDGTPVATDW